MRLLIVTHYFPPEVGAPQTRLFELARRMVDRGHRVTVLTPMPSYPSGVVPAEYRGRSFLRERLDGVEVLRLPTYIAPNRGFARRLLNHLSFTLAAILFSPLSGPADAVFVESPPLFHGVAGVVVGWMKRAAFVFNVADIWPASAVEMGMLRNRAAIRLAEALEMWIYRRAHRVTVVARGSIRRLRERGVPEEKLMLLTNGVDADVFRFSTEDREHLRGELGVGDRFVALYAGTHGLAQGLDVIVEAARRLPDVRFLFVGDGADKERVASLASGVANVTFLTSQPKERMPALLSAADCCVIPLRDLPLFRDVIPSKIYEAMAVERPIVLGVAGEAADLLAASSGGIAVPPEDPGALAEAIQTLTRDPVRAAEMGRKARQWVKANHSRADLALRFESILQEAAGSRSRRIATIVE